MEYTRETLIKRLEEYVGILPSELYEISNEAVYLLKHSWKHKGGSFIRIEDAINVLTELQDGSGLTYEIISHAIRDILLLPTFDNRQQWIPCSYGLPDEGVSVLATIGNYVEIASLDETTGWEWLAESASDYWEECCEDVIAWMPLPKPYREKSEVEE